MTAEALLDRALVLTALPPRHGVLDDYAHDMDDTASVRACKHVAVRMAKLGDEEATLLALQHAAAHTFKYAEV